MDIKKILAKVAKGEELTEAEKTFLSTYDPEKATNDAAAAARRKAEEELKRVQTKLDELTAESDAVKKKAEEEKKNGMTESEKLTAQLKALTDKVTAAEAKTAAAEAKANATLRSQTIRLRAKEAGIVLAPKTVNEDLFFGMLESSLKDIDISDADKLGESLKAFKASNAGIISAGGAGGAGNVGSPGSLSTDKNPWSKDSFNLTKQIELETTNPEQAKACKAAAGVGE